MNILRRPIRYSHYNAVFWLIGINFVFYLLMYFLGFRILVPLMSMRPLAILGGGWVWTFVTYMFVHGGLGHIIFNMLALYIFGTQVERHMGSGEFLLFYLLTGTLAGIFSFLMYLLAGQYGIWLMGASGAVFAVSFAYAVLYPESIIYIWGILPVRAPLMVIGFTVIELFSQLFRTNSGVAHLTHLAGFGFAWLYFVFRCNINPWNRLRFWR